MNIDNKEIERKFLISFPGDGVLAASSGYSDIEQTYLLCSEHGGRMRVRKRGKDGVWVYTKTEKKHITDITRMEIESVISAEEYAALLEQRDPEMATVHKRRYCYDYRFQTFEIDIYPFWKDKAVMELELSSEDQIIEFPPEVTVISEVTFDKEYTNVSISRKLFTGELKN